MICAWGRKSGKRDRGSGLSYPDYLFFSQNVFQNQKSQNKLKTKCVFDVFWPLQANFLLFLSCKCLHKKKLKFKNMFSMHLHPFHNF
jgi:hypothetical protein